MDKRFRRVLHSLILFVLMNAMLFTSTAAKTAHAKVYIDIDSPAFKQFPVAVAPFVKLPGSQPPTEDLSAWFSEYLSKYLDITGFFKIIPVKAFLEDPQRVSISSDTIQFSDWTAIGVEYLVKGGYFVAGPASITTEFRLFDVIKGELVVGKRYLGKYSDRREMVKKFAEEILLALTGEAGIYDTRIITAVKKGRTADIYGVPFDSALQGSGPLRMTNEQSLILSPRWSPDGKYLAYVSYRDGNPDLYIKDVTAAGSRKVAGFKGLNLCGAWSPDGKKMLITLSKDGNAEIYLLDVGSLALKRLTNHFAIDVSPVWSPDGQQIAFVSDRAGSKQIYVMGGEGENPRRLTSEGNYNTSPAWSPKGKRIAFEGLAGGRFQVFTIAEDGSQLIQLTTDAWDSENPTWSPDGRYLTYTTRKGNRGKLMVMNINGSNPRELLDCPEGCLGTSWSPLLK